MRTSTTPRILMFESIVKKSKKHSTNDDGESCRILLTKSYVQESSMMDGPSTVQKHSMPLLSIQITIIVCETQNLDDFQIPIDMPGNNAHLLREPFRLI